MQSSVNKVNHPNYWIPLSILGAASIIACVLAHLNEVFPGDLSFTIWIQSAANSPLTITMKVISFLFGDLGAVMTTIVVAIIVWWRAGMLEGLMILAGGVTSVLNFAIKYAVNRPRPTSNMVQILVLEQQTSFPSGHACFAVIILGMLTYFAIRKISKKIWRIIFIAGVILLTLLLGISRVYLGAHWLSDIIGGYLVGGFLLVLLIWFYNIYQKPFKKGLFNTTKNRLS